MRILKHAFFNTLLFFLILFSVNTCAVGPVNGGLFTYTKFPGEFNAANTVFPGKSGEGCQHLILGLVSYGTAGAGEIAMKSGIKKIAYVDHSTVNVLQVLYSRYCTIVWGE